MVCYRKVLFARYLCALDKSFPLGVFCRVYYSKLKVIRYVAGITTRDAGEITQRLYGRHAVIQVPRFYKYLNNLHYTPYDRCACNNGKLLRLYSNKLLIHTYIFTYSFILC